MAHPCACPRAQRLFRAAIVGAAATALATACTAPAQVGRAPGNAGVQLTSSLAYKPFTPNALSFALIQRMVSECEARNGEHCREHQVPTDQRGTLVPGTDKQLWVYASTNGLVPDRTYAMAVEVVGPEGGTRWSTAWTVHAPPDRVPTLYSNYGRAIPGDVLARWTPGTYQVRFVIDGTTVASTNLAVIEPGSKPATG